MRVIAGTARRQNLITPKGDDTRPTQDRIKETLFNMIQMDVPNSVFVDLFAGSGGIGIEALSRGAKRAYFIENSNEPYKCIVQNLQKTHLEDKATVFRKDVVIGLRNIREDEVDIVFVDPPYKDGAYERTIEMLSQMPYVTDYTMIICESSLDEDFTFVENYGFQVTREKLYKTNKHVFIKKIKE
ncbi:MAG: 16S rRNA (guanine(966)-N(2))-methyltransferase RsmD [Butyrivibrio sp.]|nr:16S rRNA (guanine(966)-N(2))-methyltransferase RsmD [Butyrivibrio sp.]